jgi:hypothetical protein
MTPIVRSCVKDCNDDSLIAKYVLEKEYEEEPAEGGGQIVCP